MQIALTKKLATAMEIKPAAADESVNPLFCWTANWTNTFDKRKEDMVVMVNHATRFTITIYGIKRGQFKNIGAKMIAAIRNTLLAMNLSPELVDEYIRLLSVEQSMKPGANLNLKTHWGVLLAEGRWVTAAPTRMDSSLLQR